MKDKMENNEDLKPCPFCGGEAEIVMSGGDRRVDCKKCGARSDWYDTEAEAIAAWNRRDYLTEELQAKLKKIAYYEEDAGGASVADLLADNRHLREQLEAIKNSVKQNGEKLYTNSLVSNGVNATGNYPEKQDSSKLTYADVERMVKPLEWELQCQGGGFVARVGDALFKISWVYKLKYVVFYNAGMIEGGFTLLDEAKQVAQRFLIDLVADALGVERSGA